MLHRHLLSCFTQVTKPFLKKTDMTVSEQRELGLVIFYPMHGGGGGF